MATKDRVLIELYVDDQGTVKIQNAKAAVQDLGTASQQSFAGAAAAGENFAGSLVRQLGIYALLVTAAYKLEQVTVGAFKAGIQAVDDYNVRVIGIAATWTDMAKSGQGSMGEMFARNKAAAEDMYRGITVEAAKHFSSAREGFMVLNRLAQSGYVVRQQEIGALLTLTDKIKLATQGQNVEMQLNTEIIALMQGQARAQSMLAMELQSRLGPGWKDLVAQHKKAGDLLAWITSLYPGLSIANRDIEDTMNAQHATTKGLLELLAIGGLSGAYQDIVGWQKQINDYLRDHRDELVSKIADIWKGISGSVSSIAGFIVKATVALADFGAKLDQIAQNPLIGILWGAAAGSRFGPWGAMVGGAAGGMTSAQAGNYAEVERGLARQKASQGMGPSGEAAETYYGSIPGGATDVQPPGGKTGKGGGGGKGRDTTDSLKSLIMQLRQEEAKLADGAFAGVEAAYAKTVAKITKLAMDQQQLDKGLLAAKDWKAAKEQKISDDFNKWYLGQMHQTTAAQIDEDLKRLNNVEGKLDLEGKAREVMYQHAVERAEKLALAENQQQKASYDSLASSSVLIADQVAWKERSWLLEKKISQAQLEQWFIGKDLTISQKENYRQLLGLTNAAKEYNLVRQRAVDLGTLEGWAIERAGEALKKEKTTIKDLMEGSEKYLTDTLSTGITGVLSRDRQKLTDIWRTIFQSAILGINQKSITTLFSSIAKLKAGGAASTTGAGGVDATGKSLSIAAKDLQKGGLGLNSAGLQLATSAGGLLLSGIGIATNSQALVIAGTVLQLAGLAIQLYEALTSTITVASMTMAATTLSAAGLTVGAGGGALIASAGALSAAAFALMAAAALDAVPFLHGGGLVAHEGLLVAHNGLLPDERLILAQTGEGILQRSAMAAYAGMGISFDDLNNARLPVRPVPVPGNFTTPGRQAGGGGYSGPSKLIIPLTINQVSPDGKTLSKHHENLVVDLVQKRFDNREIRIPASAVRKH